MPSSSARCAQLPRALDKVPFYTALRKFRDFLKGTLDELKEEDIAFANIKIRNLKKDPEKMAALAGDSLLKGESIVEDFMGSELLRPRDMLEEEIQKEMLGADMHKNMLEGDMHKNMLGNTDMHHKELSSDLHKELMSREGMIKTELMSDMSSDRMGPQDLNNMDMDPIRREMMGSGSGDDSMKREMIGEDGRRDMLYGNSDPISGLLGDEQIKLEMNDLCVKEELEEDEEVSKITPQSLFKLNGMSREQLESLDCPTIPIRKKRGRPKKTPDDPNMPDRPRPRSMSQQQQHMAGVVPPGGLGPPGALMCNGLSPPLMDDMPRKKRGRPKKVLPDGSVPPPKRPGRKPKALKEMLQQQQQHGPPMGHMGAMPLHDTSPHHMALNHMNGIMSPQGFSPNHNNQTFSPQYGGGGAGGQPPMMGQHGGQGMHNPQQQYMHPHSQMGPMHQGSGLTPTHPGAAAMNHNTHNTPLTPGSNSAGIHPSLHHNPLSSGGNPCQGGRGPTPHQFGQSPGYTSSPVTPQHHMPPHYPGHMHQHTEPHKHELPPMEEDHQLGLSPPPASPVMAQPDFDPPTSMPESEPHSLPSSDARPTPLTPNHPSPAPSHMDTSQPMHSNPSTPVDHSNTSYSSFPPSYQSSAPHHSPAKHVSSPSMASLGGINKSDVASKSLSGLESLVDQIPSISGDHHETSSQHSTHSSTHSATHSNNCSNPTTPAPPPPQQASHPPFSPGPPPYGSNSSSYPSQPTIPQASVSHYNSPQHPYSPHYSSPQQQAPYSPHYSSNSTNLNSTNFSVSSLAHSSLTTSLSYSNSGPSTHSSTPATSPSTTPSTSSFSVSSLTGGSPTPAPSLYSSSSYSPVPPGPSLSHSSYPEIMGSPMLAPTPPMGSSFMGSPGLMSSPGSMSSMPGSGGMGAMGSIHSPMSATASQLPYPYSQYSDSGPPHYPSPASHASFPHYPSSAPPGFHVPSPRFPYPSPYSNSPYAQGYSQNAMLERIKHSGMGMGFGSF